MARLITEEEEPRPFTPDEAVRARAVDLIDLPPDVQGTNCGNCNWSQLPDGKLGQCTNPKVNVPIDYHDCCNLWDHDGTVRKY